MAKLILCGHLIILLYCSVVNSVIIHPPTSLNVTLGSTAVFHCYAEARVLYWKIFDAAGHELNFISFTDFDGNYWNSTLHVPANNETDNSTITCAIVTAVGMIEKHSVVLNVQGPPGIVTTLKAVSMKGVISLQWTPPFTLDITNVQHDLWYSIVIINITKQGNSVAIQCKECPLYEPWYNFTASEPNPCDVFGFTVYPANDAGVGNASEMVTGHFLADSLTISEEDINTAVTLLPQGDLQITLSIFIQDTLYCPGQFLQTIQICIKDRNSTVYTDSLLVPEDMEDNLRLTPFTSGALTLKQVYNISVEVTDGQGNVISFGMSELYAYPSTDIDSAIAATTNGSICITCHFTPGTTIQGCAVELYSDDYNHVKITNVIPREENSSASKCLSTAVLMEGNYTVEVYVVDSSGQKGDIPLYILQTSVPLPDEPYTSDKAPTDKSAEQMCLLPCIGGAGGGVIFTIAAILLCFLVWKCWISKTKKTVEKEEAIPMRQNLAYEDTQTPRVTRGPQPTELKQCPAYDVLKKQN